MAPQSQYHYLEMLGVKRGATMDEIHTAYYLLIERYSHNPTETEVEDQHKLQHAYNILCRSYDEGKEVRDVEGDGIRQRGRLMVAAFVAVIAIAVLVAMNWSEIKVKLAHIEPGTVVRLNDHRDPYATVLGFDDKHRFHTGNTVPAYELRLAATGETVWLNKRVVVKGMKAMLPTEDDR